MVINMAEDGNDIKRVVVADEDLPSMDKDALITLWIKQGKYISFLEQKHVAEVKELESKLQQALHDVQRKEDLMIMRLSSKEQEVQDYMNQISEMKSASANSAVRTLLLDPAVNFVIEKLKRELSDTKAKLEETQSELSAWKFTPDSQTGKRLMAKCRLLHQENEDLGKVVASGKLAKLETELALQRNLAEEMKKSQSEMDEFVQELDEDVEGMQTTILYLQQQLREAKAQSAGIPSANGLPPPAAPAAEPAEPTEPTEPTSELNGHAEPVQRTRMSESGEQPAAAPVMRLDEPESARATPPPAAEPSRTSPEPTAEPSRASPEPGGRRRRRRQPDAEPGSSPEPRTKRRAAAADESPGRRVKRTRSTDDNGVSAD